MKKVKPVGIMSSYSLRTTYRSLTVLKLIIMRDRKRVRGKRKRALIGFIPWIWIWATDNHWDSVLIRADKDCRAPSSGLSHHTAEQRGDVHEELWVLDPKLKWQCCCKVEMSKTKDARGRAMITNEQLQPCEEWEMNKDEVQMYSCGEQKDASQKTGKRELETNTHTIMWRQYNLNTIAEASHLQQ